MTEHHTHGAITILASDTGKVLCDAVLADRDPMPLIGCCTSLSHPSSWEDNCDPDDVYHEPAWLACRTAIMKHSAPEDLEKSM